MEQRFEEALNECLESLREGQSIESCLRRFPDYQEKLMPLLDAALPAIRAASSIRYGSDAKARGRVEMMRALAEGRMARRRRRFYSPFALPFARPVLLGFVAVFLVAVAAGGTTAASSGSVPGEALYWVKTTRESVELTMRRSDADKAETHVRLAASRTDEIRRLVAQQRYAEANLALSRLRYHLSESAAHAGVVVTDMPVEMPRFGNAPTIDHRQYELMRLAMERDVALLKADLVSQMQGAPPRQRLFVQRIIWESDLGYRIVIEAFDSSDLPSRHIFWRVPPPSNNR